MIALLDAGCAPQTREENVAIGADGTGGSGGGGGRGGAAGSKATGGGGQAGAFPPNNDNNNANVDAGFDAGLQSQDATSLDTAAKLDAAPRMDAPAKLDAAPKLDAASPTKAALVGEPMNCNAAGPPAEDVLATFESTAVETVAVGDRTPAAPAQIFTDGTAGNISVTTALEARCSSTKSSVYSGSGFTFWGAVVALDFKGPLSPRQFYDATRYKGIAFYARAAAATVVRLKISDKNNARWGDVCTVDVNCDDYWGRQLQLGPEWKRYYVAFNDLDTLRPPVFGPFVPKETTGIEFVAPANAAFEIHVDDIAFVK